jgi:hypothetical protein
MITDYQQQGALKPVTTNFMNLTEFDLLNPRVKNNTIPFQ